MSSSSHLQQHVLEFLSNLLLFALVFGMSATIEWTRLVQQLQNRHALLIGTGLQFVILPLLGYLVTQLCVPHTPVLGLMILVITSSPGGTFSNMWCSLFNADLALSVTMTAVSTVVSTVLLPLNVYVYAQLAYRNSTVVQQLDWRALYVSLGVVLGGIAAGLVLGAKQRPSEATEWRRRANRLGSAAGCLLILVSIAVHQQKRHHASGSSGEDSVVDDPAHMRWLDDSGTDTGSGGSTYPWTMYVAVALPPMVGMGLALYLAAAYCNLPRPECVAVAIESCNQNTGIATTVALSLFTGRDVQRAMGVPLVYGIVSMVLNAVVCITCWKWGWTKAPVNENCCTILVTSYEIEPTHVTEQEEAIEVVMSSPGGSSAKGGTKQLIFAQSAHGDYVVDEATLDRLGDRDDTLSPTEMPSDSSEEDDPVMLQEVALNDNDAGGTRTSRGGKRLIGRTISKIRARTAGYRLPPTTGEPTSPTGIVSPSSSSSPDTDERRPSPYASVPLCDSPEQTARAAFANVESMVRPNDDDTETIEAVQSQRRMPSILNAAQPRRLLPTPNASYATLRTTSNGMDPASPAENSSCSPIDQSGSSSSSKDDADDDDDLSL